MAQRRMFSLQIVDTDAFMDMPLSSQALYFHLGMRADDDGFVSNARRVQKLVGASDDDLKILLMKRFILAFESGVIVIKHWKISNYIQKDRYRPTLYKEEKATLFLKPDGAYTDHPAPGAKPCLPAPSEPAQQQAAQALPGSVSELDTDCIHRLGKDRLGEDRLGKDRLNILSGGDGGAREAAEEAVTAFVQDRGRDTSVYFGMTPEIKGMVEMLTLAIFKRFATRAATEEDFANTFFYVYHSERNEAGEWTMTLLDEKKQLLMYAFEQAAAAGKPADWRYIDGIMARLYQRGISTLEQADDYDYKRNGW